MSQFELVLESGISARHLSFVENGRSAPSRDTILRLAEELDLPLRERNHLLLAAGYAPVYAQRALRGPEMAPVLAALRGLLRADAVRTAEGDGGSPPATRPSTPKPRWTPPRCPPCGGRCASCLPGTSRTRPW